LIPIKLNNLVASFQTGFDMTTLALQMNPNVAASNSFNHLQAVTNLNQNLAVGRFEGVLAELNRRSAHVFDPTWHEPG
jgi:hypothetical protein